MKEALLYQKLEKSRVKCNLCAHPCVINPGKKGNCRVRENIDGTLYTLVYGRTIAQHIDPIEKKPLYHFYPGSTAYSIATPGCNFHCKFCQNWNISQISDEKIVKAGMEATPEQIVSDVIQTGCKNIAYTYTEPTIFYEYSYDTARIAHDAGLRNIYVSNGYMTTEMLEMISPYLDAINIDLKTFKDQTYRKYIGARLQPILDSLKEIKRLNIWLEVTSLIIPGINDDQNEIRDIAGFVAAELGPDVPWHISRFIPAYQMKEVSPTPVHTLEMAREIGLESGLHYIYIGNLRDSYNSHTECPQCGKTLIERSYFQTIVNNIQNHRCPDCGMNIAGIGM